MEKNEYTPTTPAERAALAEARERDARRQKAFAATKNYAAAGTAIQTKRPAAVSQTAKNESASASPAYGGAPRKARTRTADNAHPTANGARRTGGMYQPAGEARQTAKDTRQMVSGARQTTGGARTAESGRTQNQIPVRPAPKTPRTQSAAHVPARTSYGYGADADERADTNEFPTYVHAGKKGGYKPPKPKKRRVAPYRRKKLDPRFRAALLALGALLLIFLVLFFCGVRYTGSACADGRTIKFFGIVRSGAPESGWISASDPGGQRTRGRLTEGNTITYSDGSMYVGGFEDYKKEGQGTLTYANGDVYTGLFADDRKNGYGTLTYAGGDVYEGNFENDYPSGAGKMTYADGSVYEGQFAAGRKNGSGVYTSGAASFEGTYVNDVKEGYGKQVFANGDVYEGNYKNDMRNGQGTYTFANGETYTGSFKDNQLTGEGTYTWPSGRTITGIFENGVIISSTAGSNTVGG